MEHKVIRLLDDGTDFWVLTYEIDCDDLEVPNNEWQAWNSGGFNSGRHLFMAAIQPGAQTVNYDPYEWANRTRQIAHMILTEDYAMYNSGDTLDIRQHPIFDRWMAHNRGH